MQIKIIIIGRPKEKIYNTRVQKYIKWISKDIRIEVIYIKDTNKNRILTQIEKLKQIDYFSIGLSERGKQMNSNTFSKFIFNNKQKLAFIMGGPDGHPPELFNKIDYILSLSKMTMPHEMATLVLTEQIYRALPIKKGSKYHRR